jgi:hypothetical protein
MRASILPSKAYIGDKQVHKTCSWTVAPWRWLLGAMGLSPLSENLILGDMTCFAIDVAEVVVCWHVVGG